MSDSENPEESLDAGQEEESEENERPSLGEEKGPQSQPQLLYQQHHKNSFMQYAGSTSSSGDGDSSVSSTSSDDDSDGEEQDSSEDSWELTKITEDVLNLPRGLCENPAVFHEFFSIATWQDLPLPIQNHLQQFLPDFAKANLPPQLVAVEKARTLSMLFNGSLQRFQQTPMVQLQRQLEAGNYRPDIKKLKDNILKSQKRERKFQHCERLSQMAKQLFLSRQRLLNHAQKSLPEIVTRIPPGSESTTVVTDSSKRKEAKPVNLYRDNKLSAIRARKRFFSEITQISHQVGISTESGVLSADEDEDDNDRQLDDYMKKDLLQQQRSALQENEAAAAKPNIPLAERCVYSTLFRKRMDCEDEIAFRLQQKSRQTRLTNGNFKEYLREHKRRKLTEPTLPEFETSDIRLRDVCGRAGIGGNFKRMFGTGKTPGRKVKISTATTTPSTTTLTQTTTPGSNSTTPQLVTSANKQQQEQLSFAAATATGQAQYLHQHHHHHPQQHHPLQPPPSKLSEPPALVPIQPIIKKIDSYHHHQQQLQTPPRIQQNEQHSQSSMDLNVFHKTGSSKGNNNSNDTLNISSFMSGHSDNLNLCMDETSLLAGDHDAFNMLDNEVELQQEEVETFAGASSDDNLSNYVIGDDIVLGSRNDTSSAVAAAHKSSLIQHINNAPQSSHQPMPKLEPIARNNDMTHKHLNKLGNVQQKSSTLALNNNNGVNSHCGSELIQETHACYFSLIRDFFCSTPNHRMRYEELKSKIDTWLRNPITALNEWYALADNWSNLLHSAINYLLGEFPGMSADYVPYIEHKVQVNIYQWIGAGRDSDTKLINLCNNWMEKRKLPNDQQQQYLQKSHSHPQMLLDTKLDGLPKSQIENDESSSVENGNIQTPPLPPPRCPTTWTVRAATPQEIEEFQRQERERFDQPHKAYTYRMYGYESVVAPVKGIYTPMLVLSKPRGHSMMVENRPNFVTILTLVRDATARLPNGEGTRADISELLKCSQYINQDAAENVLQTIVSGALDRMHTENDPCVRYDPKKKIWIYLHRDRSEDDFERIHQQNHNQAGKTKKIPQQRKSKPAMQTANSKFGGSPEKDSDTSLSDSVNSSLISLPALVPSKPIIVSNSSVTRLQQQLNLQGQQKCPPVPPLKYNIPHPQQQQQQQQKSLLKSAARQENRNNPQFLANKQNLNKLQQQYQTQTPINKTNSNSSIIVTTPKILQTTQAHASNTSTGNSSSTANNSLQQQPSQQTNLTANLAGKRVMLNKPIIINQVTNQQQQKLSMAVNKMKSPQQMLKQQQGRVHTLSPQQQQQMQQQLQSNVITIPISLANNLSLNNSSSTSDHHQTTKDNLNTQQQLQQQQHITTPATLGNKQNIIRLVPASNVKTIINSPTGQQIVNRQNRLVTTSATTTTNAERVPQQLKTSSTIQQLLTNNGNVITVNSATGTVPISTISGGGSIVKMSPQAFTALQQQKQVVAASSTASGQQQPHIVVKQGTTIPIAAKSAPGLKPQRIILGNTAVMAQSMVQGKNIIFQQIPMSSGNNTSTTTATTTTNAAGNKIQTINTSNLTPQQQRILIQNLKQQQQQHQQQTQAINQNQIHFKTVQVVANNTSAATNQRITSKATSETTVAAPASSQSQDINLSSPQQHSNVTRIVKTSPQTVKASNIGNRVITSSSGGQIISLDNLIQKQGGTLRIAGTGNATGTLKTNGNQQFIAKTQQPKQQQQQFAIVSVPNSIISLGNSNFSVGQRIITTQAVATSSSVNTTTVNADGATKVSPTVVATTATGQRRLVTNPPGNKLITKTTAVSGTTGNIRVLNTVNQSGGINLTTLQGKQVILTPGKTMTTLNKAQIQQSTNVLQTISGGSIVIGGQTIKLQQGSQNIPQIINKSGNIQGASTAAGTNNSGQMQTVIMGNQVLRVQQMPQIVATNKIATNKSVNESGGIVTSTVPKTIFVGASGQTLRVQTSASSSSVSPAINKNVIVNTNQQNASAVKTAAANISPQQSQGNRVVLAVQGGGQIFLSPNVQGSNLNLKSLQGLKMVSLTQSKERQTVVNAPAPSSPTVNLIKTSSISTSSTTANDGNL